MIKAITKLQENYSKFYIIKIKSSKILERKKGLNVDKKNNHRIKLSI